MTVDPSRTSGPGPFEKVAPPQNPHGGAPSPNRARDALGAVRAEVAKAVVGQDPAVAGILIALLCRGHILLEGVPPGVAKTLLVRSVAAALDVETKRVQFTPDLMPGDVTGSLVFDAASSEFTFREGGPVFTNLLLADEINRTPAEDSGVVAGGDGGAAGDRRRGGGPPAAQSIPGGRDAEPPSSTKGPIHCRRLSSTVSS